MIIPIFISHQGCRQRCIFCNQHEINSNDRMITAQDVEQTIVNYLQYSRAEHVEIAFYGGSFTALSQDQQLELLAPAAKAMRNGNIQAIRLSTRPDCIDDDNLLFLWNQGVRVIELGVQSLQEDVLVMAKRGHTADDVCHAVELIRRYPFTLGIQLMPGLPNDSLPKFIKTVQSTIHLRPDFVRLYPAVVLDRTEMGTMYRRGDYRPITVKAAVKWCAKALTRFYRNNIPVIRIGLQYNDQLAHAVLAGPFHPAFGELVLSYLARQAMYQILRTMSVPFFAAEWKVHPRDLSIIRGQKNMNARIITRMFKTCCFCFTTDNSIQRGCVMLYRLNNTEISIMQNIKNIEI